MISPTESATRWRWRPSAGCGRHGCPHPSAELPAETSQAIYDRMTSERVREAKGTSALRVSSRPRKSGPKRIATAPFCFRTPCAPAKRIAAWPMRKQTISRYPLTNGSRVFRPVSDLAGLSLRIDPGLPTLVLAPSSEFMKFFDAGPSAAKVAAQPPPMPSSAPAPERQP